MYQNTIHGCGVSHRLTDVGSLIALERHLDESHTPAVMLAHNQHIAPGPGRKQERGTSWNRRCHPTSEYVKASNHAVCADGVDELPRHVQAASQLQKGRIVKHANICECAKKARFSGRGRFLGRCVGNEHGMNPCSVNVWREGVEGRRRRRQKREVRGTNLQHRALHGRHTQREGVHQRR